MPSHPPPGRRPTIADVAQAAGVSPALVSFALNDRPGVAAATRQRILEVAGDLGYRADPAARSLRTGQTGTFAMVLRNYTNPYFLDVTAAAQQQAVGAGATVLVVDSDYDESQEHAHIERLAAARADGLAIAPVGAGGGIARWRQIRPGSPVVVLNAAVRGHDDAMRVAPDGEAAVRLALQHLSDIGHRRIAFLSAPAAVRADHDRTRAFAEGCAGRQLDGGVVEVPLSLPAVQGAVADLLADPRPPTALIANSDHTAHAAYVAARRAGARIGRDLSVVGHDDLPTSELLDPPLTTLRVDRRRIGRAVADRLLGRASGDHLEAVQLIVRGSTAAPS